MRNIRQILVENDKRLAALNVTYNQYTGEGSHIPRTELYYKTGTGQEAHVWLPNSMMELPVIQLLQKTKSIEQTLREAGMRNFTQDQLVLFENDLINLRYDHDFEFWAIVGVKIKPKTKDKEKSKEMQIPFALNYPQRAILLPALEELRLSGVPIRVVLLKARQWGGSTLVQIYIAWLQCRIYLGFNSVIVTQVEEQARTIRSMYTRLITHYPKELGEIKWNNFEGSSKNKQWKERDTIISIGSAEKPDTLRSGDVRAAHFSEVGLWTTTLGKSPEDIIQGIEGTMPLIPESISVLESTAKGVGNYFHNVWLKAERKESNYKPVFVPWFSIENYTQEFDKENKFVFVQNKMKENSSYLWELWDMGATLEAIHWYWLKSRDMNDDWRMKSEFPSTSGEAFQSTGHRVFPPAYIHLLRKHTMDPIAKGELFGKAVKGEDSFTDLRFEKLNEGCLNIWEFPDMETKVSNRYVVSLDVGGANPKADFHVASVIDRIGLLDDPENGYVEIVAQWRGRLDRDMIAWKAVQLATWYNEALFVPEVNSRLEKRGSDYVEGEGSMTIIDEIAGIYSNVYCRVEPDKIRQGVPAKYGFMTTRPNKQTAADTANALMRDYRYIERCNIACAEYDMYEYRQDGSMGNAVGKDNHDDIVMSRMIGLWVATKYLYLPFPTIINPSAKKSFVPRKVNESSF